MFACLQKKKNAEWGKNVISCRLAAGSHVSAQQKSPHRRRDCTEHRFPSVLLRGTGDLLLEAAEVHFGRLGLQRRDELQKHGQGRHFQGTIPFCFLLGGRFRECASQNPRELTERGRKSNFFVTAVVKQLLKSIIVFLNSCKSVTVITHWVLSPWTNSCAICGSCDFMTATAAASCHCIPGDVFRSWSGCRNKLNCPPISGRLKTCRFGFSSRLFATESAPISTSISGICWMQVGKWHHFNSWLLFSESRANKSGKPRDFFWKLKNFLLNLSCNYFKKNNALCNTRSRGTSKVELTKRPDALTSVTSGTWNLNYLHEMPFWLHNVSLKSCPFYNIPLKSCPFANIVQTLNIFKTFFLKQ